MGRRALAAHPERGVRRRSDRNARQREEQVARERGLGRGEPLRTPRTRGEHLALVTAQTFADRAGRRRTTVADHAPAAMCASGAASRGRHSCSRHLHPPRGDEMQRAVGIARWIRTSLRLKRRGLVVRRTAASPLPQPAGRRRRDRDARFRGSYEGLDVVLQTAPLPRRFAPGTRHYSRARRTSPGACRAPPASAARAGPASPQRPMIFVAGACAHGPTDEDELAAAANRADRTVRLRARAWRRGDVRHVRAPVEGKPAAARLASSGRQSGQGWRRGEVACPGDAVVLPVTETVQRKRAWLAGHPARRRAKDRQARGRERHE